MFRVLGPLEASVDGVSVALGGHKQRCVLAALLLAPNRVVSRDALIEAVWGDQVHDGAASTLQVYIANLRKLLDPDRSGGRGQGLIESVAPGYVLWTDADDLDLIAFEETLEDAARHRAAGQYAQAVEDLNTALGMWHGPLLADLGDESFIRLERSRLEHIRLAASTDLAETRLALGQHTQVVADLTRLVDEQPLDERLRGLLMIALYRAERQADALAVYREGRDVLVDQLGIEPGPALASLELRILNQDPTLLDSVPGVGDKTVTPFERDMQRPDPQPPASISVDSHKTPLTRSVTTIGRRPDCAIVIADPQASRLHAEIRRTGDSYLLVDKGSSNGTRVNGILIADHQLQDGDEIEVGTTRLVFELNE